MIRLPMSLGTFADLQTVPVPDQTRFHALLGGGVPGVGAGGGGGGVPGLDAGLFARLADSIPA